MSDYRHNEVPPPLFAPIGKSRRDHGPTAKAAARAAGPGIPAGWASILAALRRHPEGMTDEELQDETRLNPSTERPRRCELVEGGFVRDSKRTRPTRSGRQAVVWVLDG